MGKHEAPGRQATRVTLALRAVRKAEAIKQAEKLAAKHLVHTLVLCFHTMVAVIVIEKTPILLMLGLVH